VPERVAVMVAVIVTDCPLTDGLGAAVSAAVVRDSIVKVNVCVDSVFAALSTLQYLTVCAPRAETVKADPE
jgi:hypothetical protein